MGPTQIDFGQILFTLLVSMMGTNQFQSTLNTGKRWRREPQEDIDTNKQPQEMINARNRQ